MNQLPSNDAMRPLEVPSWDAVFTMPARGPFERALAEWMGQQRWYRAKGSRIASATVSALFALPGASDKSDNARDARVALVDVRGQGERIETYVVPLAFLRGAEGAAFSTQRPRAVVSPIVVRGEHGTQRGAIVDGLLVDGFLSALLAAFRADTTLAADGSVLTFHALSADARSHRGSEAPRPMGREQTNTTIAFGDSFVCKIVRKLDEGPSPELELGRFLTEVGFRHAPALVGYAEVTRDVPGRQAQPVALLHELVESRDDAWEYLRGVLDAWLDGLVAAQATDGKAPPLDLGDRLALTTRQLAPSVEGLLGPNLALIRLLGARIGELHAALASRPGDLAFCPEPLDAPTRRALALEAKASFHRVLERLDDTPMRERLEAKKAAIDTSLERISFLTEAGVKLRAHGDLHLGQVLFTGTDFVIIDFEGEPARTIHERRARRSPLVDVAGILRSFDYAGWSSLRGRAAQTRRVLEPWMRAWCNAAVAACLRGWLGVADGAGILPASTEARSALLEFFLLEKCIYEIGYELDNRPDWVDIPVLGLLALTEEPARAADARDDRT